ncbi:MAG: radical SAM protein [Usitatibacter sp.]
MSPEEIRAWRPYPPPEDGQQPLARAQRRMLAVNQWAPWQMVGRRMAVGCVALEVTQRCNLDCSYCYLSESSQALKDIPIEEVYRRVDLIVAHYGPGTDVQVTGGEPTLRDRAELVAIVRYIKRRGLRSSLFTNGIKASRELLAELARAGLEDVAFHVDMTQGRVGYASERALNALRAEYVERARGLPLATIFNTTAFGGNFHELPDLVRFFVAHADVVRLASFQVAADTGRGTERTRLAVDSSTVMQAIRAGAGASLDFGAASAGHRECNGYAFGLIINGKVHDFFADPAFIQETMAKSWRLEVNRADLRALRMRLGAFLVRHPAIVWGVLRRFAALAWRERRDLLAARGKLGKISFFVHNFMDAGALDRERCEACSFMVMTAEGPMSMCVHNAKRDDYLLLPSAVKRGARLRYFNPATGALEDRIPARIAVVLTRKNARGRAKA